MQSLILASGNAGKLKEFQGLLQDYPLALKTMSDCGVAIEMPPETGETFVENAIIKARAVTAQTGCASLADDSGLVVDALNGAPGVYSARYAGEGAGAMACNQKLLVEMADIPQEKRDAYFYCALCVMRYPDDPMPLVATGQWHGVVGTAQQGEHGFGYDPLFFVPDLNLTAAQLDPALKRAICHRGQALKQLLPMIDNWLASS